MCHNVPIPLTGRYKALITQIALVGPIPCMRPHMYPHIRGRTEFLLAYAAFQWIFALIAVG